MYKYYIVYTYKPKDRLLPFYPNDSCVISRENPINDKFDTKMVAEEIKTNNDYEFVSINCIFKI